MQFALLWIHKSDSTLDKLVNLESILPLLEIGVRHVGDSDVGSNVVAQCHEQSAIRHSPDEASNNVVHLELLHRSDLTILDGQGRTQDLRWPERQGDLLVRFVNANNTRTEHLVLVVHGWVSLRVVIGHIDQIDCSNHRITELHKDLLLCDLRDSSWENHAHRQVGKRELVSALPG